MITCLCSKATSWLLSYTCSPELKCVLAGGTMPFFPKKNAQKVQSELGNAGTIGNDYMQVCNCFGPISNMSLIIMLNNCPYWAGDCLPFLSCSSPRISCAPLSNNCQWTIYKSWSTEVAHLCEKNYFNKHQLSAPSASWHKQANANAASISTLSRYSWN